MHKHFYRFLYGKPTVIGRVYCYVCQGCGDRNEMTKRKFWGK